jgi:hypothetical protein
MQNSLWNQPLLALLAAYLLASCAPLREFVKFGDAGTFHPGPRHGSGSGSDGSDEEYDSYELIDHGAPNHGVPPMYSGQPSYQGGGYPASGPHLRPLWQPPDDHCAESLVTTVFFHKPAERSISLTERQKAPAQRLKIPRKTLVFNAPNLTT